MYCFARARHLAYAGVAGAAELIVGVATAEPVLALQANSLQAEVGAFSSQMSEILRTIALF